MDTTTDRISQLERLQKLRADGVLSDAEFAHEKAIVTGVGAAVERAPARKREVVVIALVVFAVLAGAFFAFNFKPTMQATHGDALPAAKAAAGPELSAAPAGVSAEYPGGDRQTSIPALEARWIKLEDECGRGDQTQDDAVCQSREDVRTELEKRGICWSYSDWRVFPTEYQWHPCSEPAPPNWKPDPIFDKNIGPD